MINYFNVSRANLHIICRFAKHPLAKIRTLGHFNIISILRISKILIAHITALKLHKNNNATTLCEQWRDAMFNFKSFLLEDEKPHGLSSLPLNNRK